MNAIIRISKATAMREANFLVKTGNITRAEAMRKGTMIAKLYALFAIGAVAHLEFYKADGTVRQADAISPSAGEFLVKGTGRETPKENILFCDKDLNGAFRSFRKANIISVAA